MNHWTENDWTEAYLFLDAKQRAHVDALQEQAEALSTKLERIRRAWWGFLWFFEAAKLHRRIDAIVAYRRHLVRMYAATGME